MPEHIGLTQHTTTSATKAGGTLDGNTTAALNRLAMNGVTTYKWSLLDDVDGYLDAGYKAIGLWRPKLADFGEERSVELLRDSRLKVSSLSCVGGFTGFNGYTYLEALDEARDTIRLAADLEASCVVVVSGGRCGHTRKHSRRLVIDALKTLGDFAGPRGIKLALEPMHAMFAEEWTFLNGIDATLDLLDDCGRPNVQMALNVYHMWREPGLLRRLPHLAPQIALVQLSDWRRPPQSELDRAIPGDGMIPLDRITSKLLASDYDGFFEIEIWSEEVWNSDYRDLLDTCRSRFAAYCRGGAAEPNPATLA